MQKKKRASFVSSMLVAALCGGLVVQPAQVLAAPNETFGFGTAATMGAAPPDGQSVAGNDLKVASRTGAYGYSYPIAVPPGRLGMEPSLALSYSSQGALYGGIAANWSLQIPELRVDYSDGRLSTLLAPETALPWKTDLAGGHRLVAVNEPAPSGYSSFRAEVDSGYVRYQRKNTPTDAGPIWVALTTEGKKLSFGSEANILGADDEPSDLVDRAPLTREQDKFGNVVDYYWRTNGTSQSPGDDVYFTPTSYWLERIEYTKNATIAKGKHFAEVRFEYGDAMYCAGADIPVGAASDHHGQAIRIDGANPLNAITTHVRDEPDSAMREVRRLALKYDSKALCPQNTSANRYLTSIAVTGTSKEGGSTSANPVTFSYGPTQAAHTLTSVFDASGPAADETEYPNAIGWGHRRRYSSVESQLIDLDGDGRLDRIYSDISESVYGDAANSEAPMNGCGMVWLRNEGDKFADGDPTSDGVVAVKLPTIGWDGSASKPGTGEFCSLGGQLSTKKNTDPEDECGSTTTTNLAYQFMDVDGDGRPDLVTGLHYNESLYDPAKDDSPEFSKWDTRYGGTSASTEVPNPRGEVFNPYTARSWYLADCESSGDGNCIFNTQMTTRLQGRFAAAAMGDPAASAVYAQAGDDSGTGGGDGCDSFDDDDCACDTATECCSETSTGSGVECCENPGDGAGSDGEEGHTTGGCPETPTDDDPVPPPGDWNPTPSPGGDYSPPGSLPPGTSCSLAMLPYKESGRFPLSWYRNEGPENGFFNLSYPRSMMSPISLSPNSGESQDTRVTLGANPLTHGPSSFRDIDGDGFIDAIWSDGYNNNREASTGLEMPQQVQIWSVHRGDGTGSFHRHDETRMPYPWFVPSGAHLSSQLMSVNDEEDPAANVPAPGIRTITTSELVDTNADGLLDLVYWHNKNHGALDTEYGSARIYLNTGHGFQRPFDLGDAPSLAIAAPGYEMASSMSAFGDLTVEGQRVRSARGGSRIRLSDFDSDGRADLLVRHSLQRPYSGTTDPFDLTIPAELHVNPGLGTFTSPIVASPLVQAPGFMAQETIVTDDRWLINSDFLDIDGDGQPDNVSGLGSVLFNVESRDLGDKPLRLLNLVDNGHGGTTEIRYTSQNDSKVATSGQRGNSVMPSHLWVVKQVEFTDAVSNTVSVSDVKYGDPVWAKDNRGKYGFRGFETIETSSLHEKNTNSGFSVSEQVYGYDVDWSGRVVETAVYADGFSKTQKASGGTTQMLKFELFGGATRSFLATETTTLNCEREDGSFGDCRVASGSNVNWKAIGANSGVDLAYVNTSVSSYGSSVVVDGTKFQNTEYVLHADAEFYWLQTSEAESSSQVNGTTLTNSKSILEVDDTGRYIELEGTHGDAYGSFGIWYSETNRDVDTGLTTAYQDPEDRGTSANVTYEYAGFKTVPSAVRNELGHIAQSTVDLGTGATTDAYSPNRIYCNNGNGPEGSSTKRDGLGRVVDTYRFGCRRAGTYGAIHTSNIAYTSYTEGSPTTVRTTTFLGLDSLDAVVRESTFDGQGRAVRIRQTLGTGEANSYFQYNNRGHLERVQAPNPEHDLDSEKSEVSYKYDSLGRSVGMRIANLTTGVAPDPDTSDWDSSPGTNIRYGFGGAESITVTSEFILDSGPSSQTTTYKDFLGRLVRVEEMGASGAAKTVYGYDGNDNLNHIEDADGFVTTMEHDWASRRTKIVRGMREWSYAYDRNGNLVLDTAPVPPGEVASEYQTSNTYDALDRLVSTSTAPRNLSEEDQKLFGTNVLTWQHYDGGYNGIGRLSTVQDAYRSTSFVYDNAGLVSDETLRIKLSSQFTGLDAELVRSTEYNVAGMPTSMVTPDGVALEYSYDAAGRQESLDWTNAPGGASEVASVRRNVAGQVVQRDSECISRDWEYDALGRIVSTEVYKNPAKKCGFPGTKIGTGGGIRCEGTGSSGSWEPLRETMTYHDSSEVETLNVERPCQQSRKFDFAYDDQHQLVAAGDDQQEYDASFAFSPAGRVTAAYVGSVVNAPQVIGRDVTYTYGMPNKEPVDGHAVKALTDVDGKTVVADYSYDYSGNVIRRSESDASVGFDYDGADQQRRAQTSNKNEELYYYDSAGSRYLAVERSPAGSVVRSRVWFGGTEYWFGGTGTIDKRMTNLTLGGLSVARIDDRELEFSFHNGLGHLMATVEPNAEMSTGFVYGPFGEILSESGDVETHFRRFNGKEADQLSRLNYYGYRYYDPLSLTWTQADPLYRIAPDLAYDQPRKMSLYAFSMNNPVRYVDPDGRSAAALLPAGAALGEAAVGLAAAAGSVGVAVLGVVLTVWVAAAEASLPTWSMAGDKFAGMGMRADMRAFRAQAKEHQRRQAIAQQVMAEAQAQQQSQASTTDDKSDEAPIAEQKQAGHVPGTPQNKERKKQGKDTSEFADKESADALTREANVKGTPVPGREGVKDHDFGRPVGTGPNGGTQTRVRVHTRKKDGKLHGHPVGRETPKAPE